jgi:hypothetical protein
MRSTLYNAEVLLLTIFLLYHWHLGKSTCIFFMACKNVCITCKSNVNDYNTNLMTS